jgi:uncharacterized protein
MLFFAILGIAIFIFAFYAIGKGNKTLSSSGEKNGFQQWWISGAGNSNSSYNNFHSGTGYFGSGSSGSQGSGFSGFGGGSFGGGGASGKW